jgi:hypothetical protein
MSPRAGAMPWLPSGYGIQWPDLPAAIYQAESPGMLAAQGAQPAKTGSQGHNPRLLLRASACS